MEHELELIIARLEILEIEVCNISYKPRDIGNLSFSTSSYPGNIGKWIFLISHILEILDRTIHMSILYVDVAGRRGPQGVAGGSRGDGGGDGGGDVPTTLPSGQSPGPSRPGTKYPVRSQSLTSTMQLRLVF